MQINVENQAAGAFGVTYAGYPGEVAAAGSAGNEGMNENDETRKYYVYI